MAAAAREHHRKAIASTQLAAQHRAQRDQIILRLHDEGWGYKRLAAAVGCDRDTIRRVIHAAEQSATTSCDSQ